MHFPKIKISRSKADFAIQQKNQTGAQRQRVRFGKEEQRRKRALTFEKSRSKRYAACSDVADEVGFEPTSRFRDYRISSHFPLVIFGGN